MAVEELNQRSNLTLPCRIARGIAASLVRKKEMRRGGEQGLEDGKVSVETPLVETFGRPLEKGSLDHDQAPNDDDARRLMGTEGDVVKQRQDFWRKFPAEWVIMQSRKGRKG